MSKITLAQREALDVVKDMIDKSNTSIPDYGTKILTLILGILNIDCRVEHNTADITDIEGDKTIPINPNNGNDKIHINIPDWIKNVPTSPSTTLGIRDGFDPIKIDAHTQEEVRFATYTGDFRDGQTSFNDK